MKGQSKSNDVGNCRPVACLNILREVLIGTLAGRIYTFLEENNLLPEEQEGCYKGSKGVKSHLVIDKTIMKELQTVPKNLMHGLDELL